MKRVALLIFALTAAEAFAGVQTGTVNLAQTSYASTATHPGYMFFTLNGGVKTGTPACATIAGGTRWVINNSWPAAKSQLAILLMAIATGKQLQITGSNDCTVWGDSETVVDIRVLDN
jgi:hypothetical protein